MGRFAAWRRPLGPYRSLNICVSEEKCRDLEQLLETLSDVGEFRVSKGDIVRAGIEMALATDPVDLLVKIDS